MKHTPEPWHFVDYAGYHELTDAPFYNAAHLLNEDDCPNAADNANRACECVNALAGIENPKEWVEFSKNYRTMLQWEKLESQVKELREANELNLQNLKNALAVIEVTSDNADTRLVREIKSAISKSEQLLNKTP